MPFVRYTDGPAVHVEKPRPEALTPAQSLNRRHALWLHALRFGLHDPATGRIRRHAVGEIATLWGVTPRAVRLGIESARQLLTMGVDDE
jgi:hypothetical protein